MAMLIRIGNLGINLDAMTNWVFTPAAGEAPAQITLFYAETDTCLPRDAFLGLEAECVHSFLIDNAEDVMLIPQRAAYAGSPQGRKYAAEMAAKRAGTRTLTTVVERPSGVFAFSEDLECTADGEDPARYTGKGE